MGSFALPPDPPIGLLNDFSVRTFHPPYLLTPDFPLLFLGCVWSCILRDVWKRRLLGANDVGKDPWAHLGSISCASLEACLANSEVLLLHLIISDLFLIRATGDTRETLQSLSVQRSRMKQNRLDVIDIVTVLMISAVSERLKAFQTESPIFRLQEYTR